MAADGIGPLRALTASGSAPGGQPSFASSLGVVGVTYGIGSFIGLTVSPHAEPSLRELTAAGYVTYGAAVGAAATATGTAEANSVGEADVDFELATAIGVGSAGSVGTAAYSFAAMSATGNTPAYTDCALEPLAASAIATAGTVASSVGIVGFIMEATGISVGGSASRGTATFQPFVVGAVGRGPAVGVGQSTFQRLTARATALVGGVGVGAPSFEPLEALASSQSTNIANAAASFERLRAAGVASAVLADAYSAFAINTSNEALTSYSAYPFNSMAEFAGAQYGAGSTGIRRLDGVDDLGADIEWSFSTGMHDDKKAMLKRMEELLVAMRFDGPIRATVWTDDNLHFDYNIANHRPGVLHQVRAKLGKGAKSRFFRVELAGVGNTAAEIGSMQMPMIPLRRRLG